MGIKTDWDRGYEVGHAQGLYDAKEQSSASPACYVPDGYILIPIIPTVEALEALAISRWPEDWEAGKLLQQQYGCKLVPPNAEIEEAVGKYQRLITALQNAQIT